MVLFQLMTISIDAIMNNYKLKDCKIKIQKDLKCKTFKKLT